MSKIEHCDFVLHNIPPSIVDHDISIFLEYNLRLIGQEHWLGAGWPGENTIRCLVENASGLFIWAATACRFIHEGRKRQMIENRLSSVLRRSCSVTEPQKHLDEIYITVLRHSLPAAFSDTEKEELLGTLRHVLGSVVVLLSPLSTHSLGRLVNISFQNIDEILEDLHAILDIPKDQTRPLRLHHPSFRDFLLSPQRCSDVLFWVDEKKAHEALVNHCIRIMSEKLKRNICGLEDPGAEVVQVLPDNLISCCLPVELQYACRYWVDHLQRSEHRLYDDGRVHRFLREHLLHWVEALGWIGETSEGIRAIASLASMVNVSYVLSPLEYYN
jgi:hypothetical protein